MAADLRGVDLKIRRAHRHLADLKKEIADHVKASRYRFELTYDALTKQHIYTAHDVPAIDPEWSLVVGEILFNLRSALDHLAWSLVELDGGTPGIGTQFPIRPSPFDKKGRLVGASIEPPIRDPHIRDLVEEVQPYREPMGEPAPFTESPLWRLAKLNNIDKHRLLLVAVCVVDVDEMWWGHKPGDPTPTVKITGAPVEEGAPVAWFDFQREEVPADFDPHPGLVVALREEDTPEIDLVPLVHVMSQACWWVGVHIVEMRFRALFP
jgi:hypothetical protein